MKKRLISGLIVALSLVLTAGFAFAAVTGQCVNCHTMHNSQGGLPMAFDELGNPLEEPLGALVRSTCFGCHTTSGTDPLATPSGASGLYPFVMSTADAFHDNNCLAGGFFPATSESSDNHASKAHSLGTAVAPVGYPIGYAWYKGESSTTGLTCAGTSGCHGSQDEDDPMTAIKGGHHKTATYGYRILAAYNNGAPAPVDGTGAADYEKALINAISETPGDRATAQTTYAHNIYKAAVAGTDTISQLCANCHGVFHSDVGTASPWIRHPTDIALPSGWDPQQDTLVTDLDAKYNPFGFTDLNEAGAKYATCLSCHRAHGTGNDNILRFTYTVTEGGQQQAGRAPTTLISYGCLGCHSGQR
jgi:hypothetical protein